MKKLCIAVIVLSFFGVGPLKSFFQNTVGVDGTQLIQSLKDKNKIISNPDHITNYLVLEKGNPKTAMLLEYDTSKNMLKIGSMSLPKSTKDESLTHLKNMVNKNYNIPINHCFVFEPDGLAKIIDLLAPEGIQLFTEIPGINSNHKAIDGRKFIDYLETQGEDPKNNPVISMIFSSLKEEIVKNQSPEKLISLAPTIVNEAFSSITSDLGKGQLMTLGITALMNPVKSIEVIQLREGTGVAKPVALPLHSKEYSSVLN